MDRDQALAFLHDMILARSHDGPGAGPAPQRRRPQTHDYEGGSFYLSNLGVFPRVFWFDALVPLGASAILAVSAADKAGRGAITLSCDHRVLAGADAAQFMEDLTAAPENAQVEEPGEP